MITIDEVRDRVTQQLRDSLPSGVTIGENTMIESLGLSSLQISEIVFGLEEDHDVEFDAARAADAKTLGDLVKLANEAIAEKERAAGGDSASVAAASSNR